jgi:hypothetical protein
LEEEDKLNPEHALLLPVQEKMEMKGDKVLENRLIVTEGHAVVIAIFCEAILF